MQQWLADTVAKLESEEAAARNRRVEFIIVEQEEVKKTVREDQIPEDAEAVEPTDSDDGPAQ